MDLPPDALPYDWLKPGEIRYCGCGYWLLPPGKPICAFCIDGLASALQEQRKQTIADHQKLWQEANELAMQRRDSGIERLFWMKGN